MGLATTSFTARRDRYRQEFEYTADGVFSVMAWPLGEPRAGVIICPSLYEDSARNWRREVVLARRLAALGIAVRRFHYRGTGYSNGDEERVSWAQIVEDADSAWKTLQSQLGSAVPCGLMSARFGSLVAASVAAGEPVPIALWEPLTEGKAYLRDLARMERVALITRRHREDIGNGRPIPAALAAEISDLSLTEIADGRLGPVLIVRVGRAASSVAAIDDERIASLAASVEHREHPEEDTWWAGTRPQPRGPLDPWPLLDDTASWLARNLDGARR
jgi:hypothetical protein